MILRHAKVAIIVFAMPGCAHCEEYLPRLTAQVEGFKGFGHPFIWIEESTQVAQRGQIPIVVIDTTSEDPGVSKLADQYDIVGLPSTLFYTRAKGYHKMDGALDEQQIYRMLVTACEENR